MLQITRALVVTVTALGAAAAASNGGDLARITLRSPQTQLQSRRLHERELCNGGCESCFGSGYTLCPASTIICYKPNDPDYGIDSCPYGTSTARPSATGAAASSISALPSGLDNAGVGSSTVDFCNSRGSTCTTCFGSNYIECPDNSGYCYDPNDKSSTCTPGSSGAGAGAEGSSVSDTTFFSSAGATATPGAVSSASGAAASVMTSASSLVASARASASARVSSGLLPPPEESATATTQSAANGETVSPQPGTADQAATPASDASKPAVGRAFATVVIGMVAVGCAYLVGL